MHVPESPECQAAGRTQPDSVHEYMLTGMKWRLHMQGASGARQLPGSGGTQGAHCAGGKGRGHERRQGDG